MGITIKQDFVPVSNIDQLAAVDWVADQELRTLTLKVLNTRDGSRYQIQLVDRMYHCDRGHIQAYLIDECKEKINLVEVSAEGDTEDGIPIFDAADMFPRYFMDLDTAMHEAETFMMWRIFGVRESASSVSSTVFPLGASEVTS